MKPSTDKQNRRLHLYALWPIGDQSPAPVHLRRFRVQLEPPSLWPQQPNLHAKPSERAIAAALAPLNPNAKLQSEASAQATVRAAGQFIKLTPEAKQQVGLLLAKRPAAAAAAAAASASDTRTGPPVWRGGAPSAFRLNPPPGVCTSRTYPAAECPLTVLTNYTVLPLTLPAKLDHPMYLSPTYVHPASPVLMHAALSFEI